MVVTDTLVDARAPVGLFFAVWLKKLMVLKIEKIYAAAALFICVLALFAMPVKSLAAKKTAAKAPVAVAAPVIAAPAPVTVKKITAAAVQEFDVKDADPEKRAQAAAQIAGRKDPEKRAKLKDLLGDKDARVKAIAASALAKDGDASAYAALSEALDGSDENARQHAIEGMAALKDTRAAKRLIALLNHENFDTRWKATEALGGFRGGNVVDALLLKAAEETEGVYIRESAVEALFKISDKRAVEGLNALKSPNNPGLEKMAQRAAALMAAGK